MKKLFLQVNNYVLNYFNTLFPFNELTDTDWVYIILFYKRRVLTTPTTKAAKKIIAHNSALTYYNNIFAICLILINFDMDRFARIIEMVNMKYKLNFYDLDFPAWIYMHFLENMQCILIDDLCNDDYLQIIANKSMLEDYFGAHIGRQLLLLRVNYLIKNFKNINWRMGLLVSVFELAFCNKAKMEKTAAFFCQRVHFRNEQVTQNSYEEEMEFFINIQEKMKKLAAILKEHCENDVLNKKKRITVSTSLAYIDFAKYIGVSNDQCIKRIVNFFRRQRYGIVVNLEKILTLVPEKRKKEIQKLITAKAARQLINNL